MKQKIEQRDLVLAGLSVLIFGTLSLTLSVLRNPDQRMIHVYAMFGLYVAAAAINIAITLVSRVPHRQINIGGGTLFTVLVLATDTGSTTQSLASLFSDLPSAMGTILFAIGAIPLGRFCILIGERFMTGSIRSNGK